jgi:hypothetical protein
MYLALLLSTCACSVSGGNFLSASDAESTNARATMQLGNSPRNSYTKWTKEMSDRFFVHVSTLGTYFFLNQSAGL